MGSEISNEAEEVYILSIVELLEGCYLDFLSFGKSSNDLLDLFSYMFLSVFFLFSPSLSCWRKRSI